MKIPEILIIESLHKPGSLAKVLQVIGDAGQVVEGINQLRRNSQTTLWELTIETDEHFAAESLIEKLNALPNAKVIGKSDRVFNRHQGGKLQMISRQEINTLELLRDLYTPGVARVCLAIQKDPSLASQYTSRSNTVAIITNGTAILGLGNIGPLAGLPVMEGKAALMHQLVGLSGIPILVNETEPYKVIEIIRSISLSFGAIQLEDFRAPECFEIESELVKTLDIPIMHDDQHGTATVVLAALLSVAKRLHLDLSECAIGQIGLGAAGIGICNLILHNGAKKVFGSDIQKDAMNRLESIGGHAVSLSDLMKMSDIVISTTGVKNLIKPEMVKKGQVILALSNPEPEIEPEVALAQGASFAVDGKSVNNVLGFPGIFKGALKAKAKKITQSMLIAAAQALSEQASGSYLVPEPLNRSVHEHVTEAVYQAAKKAESTNQSGSLYE